MTKPMIGILDVSTGEEIIREMNDEEYANYLLLAANEEPTPALEG